MATKLTKKQKIFVKTYLETGVGAIAAREAYDIRPNDEITPRSIASENLTKPNIIEAIRRGTKDEQINEAFDKLINLKRLDYFVFAKSLSDEEITAHVEAQGITVLNIRPTEKGKMAFFAIPDARALGKALDLWKDISGANAPTKHLNVNVDATVLDPRIAELARKMNYG